MKPRHTVTRRFLPALRGRRTEADYLVGVFSNARGAKVAVKKELARNAELEGCWITTGTEHRSSARFIRSV